MTPRGFRRWLFAAALSYTAFVVYGSLVPLQFQAMSLDEAWIRFEQIPYLQLGIVSRADWVSNILLFVPLAYLALGALWPANGRFARALASGIVFSACGALSLAIEFTQVFFPQRTVSMNDLVAEAIGAAAGIVLWWMTGARAVRWAAGWASTRTRTGAANRLRYAYLTILFAYQLLPLDLTISAVEIFHKWREGKIVLMPFGTIYSSGAEQVYGLVTDVALWIPAAVLWRLEGALTARAVVLRIVACAALVEFLQLFVYSRVTSTTNLLMALVGGIIGVALSARTIAAPGPLPAIAIGSETAGHRGTPWFLGIAVWAVVLVTVFWYPFDFRSDWAFVHGRLQSLRSVPFEAYYFGSELRAVTEVLHKTLFFLPWGLLLAGAGAVLRDLPGIPAAVLHTVAAAAMLGAAGAIEAGQLFLPARHADLTDVALEFMGAVAGYVGYLAIPPVWRRRGESRQP